MQSLLYAYNTLDETESNTKITIIILIQFLLFRWTALYKGLIPKIMRLGPGGAIMIVVYEYVFHSLNERLL